MKRYTKCLVLLVVVTLLGSLVIGCGGQSNTGSTSTNNQVSTSSQDNSAKATGTEQNKTAEKIKMRYYVPGTDQPDLPNVVSAVNKKMNDDGLNLDLEVHHIGWDQWQNKTNVMLSSGEEFELMHVMSDVLPASVYVSTGALTPLDDLLTKYGPKITPLFNDKMWGATKINDKIYSVPAYWRDVTQGGDLGYITVRKDLLDKLNLPVPKTADELINDAVALKKAAGNDAYLWDHQLQRPPIWLHRTFDSWPFYADFANGIFFVDKDANVKAFVETEEFKKDSEVYRKMYKLGLIHPDILSVPPDTRQKMGQQGKFLFGLGTYDYDLYPSLVRNVPDAKLEMFRLSPDKPSYIINPVLNFNAVPSTTKHPEAAIEFLNWMYGDEKNHDLFLFGKEGEHYKDLGNNRAEFVKDSANAQLNKYTFDFWQIGYFKWNKFDKVALDGQVQRWTTSDASAVYANVAGFSFNPEPVKTEYANVLAEMTSSILPIKLGVVDYEGNYQKALAKLKAAGLDKVIKEYDTQLHEWLKNQK